MKRSLVFLLFLLVCGVAVGMAHASASAPSLGTDAYADIDVAFRLMKQAKILLDQGMTKSNIKTAIDLYLQAGQLFEKAESMLRAAGPEYASKEDVENCANSKNVCVDAIKRLRAMLQ